MVTETNNLFLCIFVLDAEKEGTAKIFRKTYDVIGSIVTCFFKFPPISLQKFFLQFSSNFQVILEWNE